MGSNNELDQQIHRRVMTSSTAPVLEYSSSLVDFQLLYEQIQKNWPYEQKMKFREELEARLKTTLPVQTGVFPQWNELMSLGVGSTLSQAGCEAALIVQGSETKSASS